MTLQGSVTTRLDASPEEVFCFVTTVDRLPEWNAAIRRVVEPLRELAPGREWVVEMRAMGNSWRSRSRVLHHESTSRLFSYRSCTDDGNPSYGEWTWRVASDAEGAHVAVSWELHPRTFWRRVLMARIRNRQLRAEVRASLQAAEACLTPARERR